jgi:hypothetical protein
LPGRTPHEAVKNYSKPIQLAVFCIDLRVVSHASGANVGRPHVLKLSRPAVLHGADLVLDISQGYEVVHFKSGNQKYKVATLNYSYVVADRTNSEVLAYQWHPAAGTPTNPTVTAK